MSDEVGQMEKSPMIRRQPIREKYANGTIYPDTEKAGVRKLICVSCLFRSQLSIKKPPYKEETLILYRMCSVGVKSLRFTELSA